MRAPPRHLFRDREREPRRREPAPDIWDLDVGDDRRFREMMPRISPEAIRAIDRMPEEAGMVLLCLFFARFRGLEQVRADGKVIDLVGQHRGRGGFNPDNLPGPLRRAWEAIQP